MIKKRGRNVPLTSLRQWWWIPRITRECCCYWNRATGYMDHWPNWATYLCSLKNASCWGCCVLNYRRGGETAQCAAAIIKLSVNKDSHHYHQFCSSIKFFIHKSPRIIQMFINEVTNLFPTHFQMSSQKNAQKPKNPKKHASFSSLLFCNYTATQ